MRAFSWVVYVSNGHEEPMRASRAMTAGSNFMSSVVRGRRAPSTATLWADT